MPRTDRFAERIGKVFLPEPEEIDGGEDFTPNPEGPLPGPGIPFPGEPGLPFPWQPGLLDPFSRYTFCFMHLKPGCYTISFRPTGSSLFSTRYHGTLRVEPVERRLRISGDFYTYRLIEEILAGPAIKTSWADSIRDAIPSDEAADTGGTIPIYPRRRYYSYLKGTGARLLSIVPKGTKCSFTLNFEEFVYNHPGSGFSGSFNSTPTRSIRFVLGATGIPNLYSGNAYAGTALIGTVWIRWICDAYRRAHLQVHTLQGAETPPAVGGTSFATIFADVGWDLTHTDGGMIPLPAALAGVNINACWSLADLHTLMSSVPGYNAADLDTVWRVHLVAVPATLGCSRGVMFDSSLGADPNAISREGSATFSRDGYPVNEVPDGLGGSHYDGAGNQQQRNVPRAFLRSATHEVGHAFNQIHQGFEGGNDNSIMTPTPGVATVLGTAGIFPDAINLAFNDRVKKHLRHLPDPAVRPGAMDFFGSAVVAPEAADVAWPETARLSMELSSDRVSLGEPVTMTLVLTNEGKTRLPAPPTLDAESLNVRINVTDPTGRVTFMRPPAVTSCPRFALQELEPGKSVKNSLTIFWGREGFAFETPGRHVVEAIALWNIAGVPVGAAAEREIFVSYPITEADNEVAAVMLNPEVGRAVASGNVWRFERAAARISQVSGRVRAHPAYKALTNLGVLEQPRKRTRKGTPKRTRSRTTRRRT